MSDFFATLPLFVAGALLTLAGQASESWMVKRERRRLQAEVLGEKTQASVDRQEDSDVGSRANVEEQAETHFAKLLIEYYAYGLTQARRSFGVSLTCSILGGLVLISGVGMAILRAESTGDQYASVTASVAGLVMTVIGTLFHRRADLALKHMEAQTQSLRQDMKVERDAGQAIRLLENVDDPALKAQLQAALILKFSAAQLPEVTSVLQSAVPRPGPSANSAVPHQQSDPASP
ncbi:TRADD-N-associated membrane domain-containing protein [Streptomyces justiciae]|uniref:TRADD-N-associated membrane domain-containing protein n=1 Tax=Streptomyces justiciae TaxID=2780140 RepID=UPI0018816B86|nr:hypothetical protein [Streptomyces justiciae]MBE8477469.1 hypothetical protein [Streptomyces justiciae]